MFQLKSMNDCEVVTQNLGYQVIRRVLSQTPVVERVSHEMWAIGYYLREQKTNIEVQIDLHVGEGFPLPLQIEWIGVGAVQWYRTWISGMRISTIFGEIPERFQKLLKFNFNQPGDSNIVFSHPSEYSKSSFSFQTLNFSFYFDFKQDKLFIF